MTQDQDLLDYLLLLRFGPCFDPSNQVPVVNISTIAKLLKRPAGTISRLLKLAVLLAKLNRETQFRQRLKFDPHHIDFLISKQTLISQAHLSLKQRAKMFHRQFPDKTISATTIGRIY